MPIKNVAIIMIKYFLGDINSRHPVILGLRNILKTACSYDITMITIPLFLTHEMTEVITNTSIYAKGDHIKIKKNK